MSEPKLLKTRRVDDGTLPFRGCMPGSRRRCLLAEVKCFGKFSRLRISFRHEEIEDRRLAHAGLSDEEHGFARKDFEQFGAGFIRPL